MPGTDVRSTSALSMPGTNVFQFCLGLALMYSAFIGPVTEVVNILGPELLQFSLLKFGIDAVLICLGLALMYLVQLYLGLALRQCVLR